MKAIQIIAPKKVEIVDVSVPKVKENEVLVKVECCVTCPQWDITLYKGVDILGRPGFPKYPIPWGYPGHEMSGNVVEVGPQVENLKVGDRVATTVSGGEFNPGFYCEYINRPEDTVVKIADDVSYEAAASLEMVRCVFPYIHILGDLSGKRVGVTGMGPAGLITLQILKSMGASEVIAIDIIPERLLLASQLGATDIVNPTTTDTKKIKSHPLQASVDCSGISNGLQTALDYTRGPVSIFGVLHGEVIYGERHRGTSILLPNDAPTKEDTNLALDLWRKKQLNTEILVNFKLPFQQYAEGIEMLIARKAIKIAFYWDKK